MRLEMYRHLWGVTQPWPEAVTTIAASGLYQGVEAVLPPAAERASFAARCNELGLTYLPLLVTRGSSVDDHLRELRRELAAAQQMGARFANGHCGSEVWSVDTSVRFFRVANELAAQFGIELAHETHRGRCLYNPRDTLAIIEAVPEMKLTCDFSHWVCVYERLLDVERDCLHPIIERCRHVHARVGYDEGPQVPDPRAPEFQREVEAHESWWDMCWAAARRAGRDVVTLTPEFGPPRYLHTLPYSDVPVADLTAICDDQARRMRARFVAAFG